MSEGISMRSRDVDTFNWSKPHPKRIRYCYLVYCNSNNPLVYAVYSNKRHALNYAFKLINWRFENARNRNYESGYYHYVAEEKKETDFDKREKLIFSVCLKIKDNLKQFSDDGCFIKVMRKPLLIR